MNNEEYLRQIIKETVIEALNESIIINEKDILYHKKEFDSGEINLCFVIGHSGSGKSTMTYNATTKDPDTIDTYSLDDLWCAADNFTMKGLKDYGDLIYSFFKGPGKKYYVTRDYLKDNNIPGGEYEDKMYPDFVHYSMKYAASHKNKKFYIEGVWLFCNGDDGKPWFSPEEFKDYAFYIKGTSMIISHIRAAKRDSEDSNHRFKSFMKIITKNWKWYHIDEKRINRFRSYFKKLMATSIKESANLDFKYKAYDINSSIGRSYILKDSYTKKYIDYLSENTGEIYVDTDNNKMIGYIFVGKTKDKGFISTLEVAKSYRGLGFGKRLLLDAIKKYDAIDLVVYKDNKIALSLYKKYGFVIIGEAKNNKAWWMKLKSKLTKEDKKRVIKESANSSSRMNIYFLSSSDSIKTLSPRVPNNFFTKNGYEDDKTKRVCFAPSIDQCLMALSQNLTGKEFYVYSPARKYNTYKPNTKEVPDSKITGEIWIKEPVELVCIGKIKVIKDKGLPGHKFTYGNNTAELYDWEWKWVESAIKESTNQSSLDKQFKKKSGKSFNIIDINNAAAIKYMKQDGILSKNLDYISEHRIGEIAVCNGNLAGYIFVTKSGEIRPIHIFEEYRGYGLSNTLMQDGITKYGARKLGVYSDNLVAIKLYKKFGFKVVGRKVYKDGSEILFMERG